MVLAPLDARSGWAICWHNDDWAWTYIDGILPKGPYPPCLRMADRALLAGYPRYTEFGTWIVKMNKLVSFNFITISRFNSTADF